MTTTANPKTESLYQAIIEDLRRRFDDLGQDNYQIVRDVLTALDPAGAVAEDPSRLADIARLRLVQHDPRLVTLDAEQREDLDLERFAARKPFIWLWQQWDRSSLGENLELSFRLKRLLAPYIFGRVGRNLKVYPGVRFTFGYNLVIGDDVTIFRDAFLDDRVELEIERGSVIEARSVVAPELELVGAEL